MKTVNLLFACAVLLTANLWFVYREEWRTAYVNMLVAFILNHFADEARGRKKP